MISNVEVNTQMISHWHMFNRSILSSFRCLSLFEESRGHELDPPVKQKQVTCIQTLSHRLISAK